MRLRLDLSWLGLWAVSAWIWNLCALVPGARLRWDEVTAEALFHLFMRVFDYCRSEHVDGAVMAICLAEFNRAYYLDDTVQGAYHELVARFMRE
jgi:hypothetical protein